MANIMHSGQYMHQRRDDSLPHDLESNVGLPASVLSFNDSLASFFVFVCIDGYQYLVVSRSLQSHQTLLHSVCNVSVERSPILQPISTSSSFNLREKQ